jgi:hypothetical protein
MPSPLKRLYQHFHDILITLWDPIGVRDEPLAQDEYDSYIPQLISLLQRKPSQYDVAQHLYLIETQRMGLPGNKDNSYIIAGFLQKAYDAHVNPEPLPIRRRVRLMTNAYRDKFENNDAPCGAVGHIMKIHHQDAFVVEFSDAHGVPFAEHVVRRDEIIPDDSAYEYV